MKLRNKKTGEIGNLVLNINPNRESYSVLSTENGDTICGNLVIGDYDTLAQLNEEWEDYEEPDVFYFIDRDGRIIGAEREALLRGLNSKMYDYEIAKSIGNVFETKEEALKAGEKLKAWKRLKDNGFKFVGWKRDERYSGDYHIEAEDYDKCDDKDLDLLFGGEE